MSTEEEGVRVTLSRVAGRKRQEVRPETEIKNTGTKEALRKKGESIFVTQGIQRAWDNLVELSGGPDSSLSLKRGGKSRQVWK